MYKKISDTDHILLLRNYCDMYTGLIRQSNWLVSFLILVSPEFSSVHRKLQLYFQTEKERE